MTLVSRCKSSSEKGFVHINKYKMFSHVVPLEEVQGKAERAQGGRDTTSRRTMTRTKLQHQGSDKDREHSEELPR